MMNTTKTGKTRDDLKKVWRYTLPGLSSSGACSTELEHTNIVRASAITYASTMHRGLSIATVRFV